MQKRFNASGIDVSAREYQLKPSNSFIVRFGFPTNRSSVSSVRSKPGFCPGTLPQTCYFRRYFLHLVKSLEEENARLKKREAVEFMCEAAGRNVVPVGWLVCPSLPAIRQFSDQLLKRSYLSATHSLHLNAGVLITAYLATSAA
ncbi:hypothetical protein YA21_03430 [Klebsiella aerogenes]|nr:hypothetical protein YA21_03430 [Klebsiella aerogenes]KTJ00776.1 hypothetical protein ASU92_09905 [Klebsiella aerogenes]